MTEKILSLLFCISLIPLLTSGQNFPRVCLETEQCFEGSWKIYGDLKYASFQGIRYAEPPVETLRFKPPLPFQGSQSVYNVSEDSQIACPQLYYGLAAGQEDCLLLNVYVPEQIFSEERKGNKTEGWIYNYIQMKQLLQKFIKAIEYFST